MTHFLTFTRLIVLTAMLALMVTGTSAMSLPVWQIGVDDDPFASGYNATHEFSSENYINDPRPGKVTRLPGDPLYNAANNPTADDDFYCTGTYPIGFNGLTTNLPVIFNEPDIAWERALTDGDRTNRVHFFLTSTQTNALTRLRLSCELVWGGVWLSLSNQSGEDFGPHDVVVRFKNGAGISTLLYSNRLDRDTRIILDFPATNVLASAGPNTIEFVRVGPITANVGYWIQFDYAKLEADTNALMDADGDGLLVGGRQSSERHQPRRCCERQRWRWLDGASGIPRRRELHRSEHAGHGWRWLERQHGTRIRHQSADRGHGRRFNFRR
ncbi:MAG: hypothetical protein WDM80_03220 [Limisphaerales bacterium]